MRNQSVVLAVEGARPGTGRNPWNGRPGPYAPVVHDGPSASEGQPATPRLLASVCREHDLHAEAAHDQTPPSDRGNMRAVRRVDALNTATRLSSLWEALRAGRVTACDAWYGATRAHVVVRTRGVGDHVDTSLCASEAVVVTRVLCGHQQKAIAIDLGLARSTISKLRTNGLAKLHLAEDPVPLPYVLAAQASAMGVEIPRATQGAFQHEGASYLAVSVPLPRVPEGSLLTPSEQEVALYLIEGCSRTEIARRRSTSVQTVSAQLSAIHSKLRLSGRHGAIALAARLGWFSIHASQVRTEGTG